MELPEKWAVCRIFLLGSGYAPLAAAEVENPAGDAPDAEPEPPAEEEPPAVEEVLLEGNLIRIGIYYKSAGKAERDMKLFTGDGFRFGYFDPENLNRFVVLASTEARSIVVRAAEETMVVYDADGAELFRHDMANGTMLGVLPYSDSGEKTVASCGYKYYGGFRFERSAAYEGTMTIVNVVDIEDYLKGVVPYEMSASWHNEALKVQAVCARTYALANRNKHKSYSFDICDGDDCQVYKGLYSNETYVSNVNAAVDGTAGAVLMYNGKYCSTVYSSSNGGASESAVNVWGSEIPYLQGVIDPYEALVADRISKYHWTVTYTGAEIQARLVESGYVNCGVIVEVRTQRSATDNVIAITFVDDGGKTYTLYRSKCRTFLSLRSIRYTVTAETGSEAAAAAAAWVDDTDPTDFSLTQSILTEDGTLLYADTGYIVESRSTVTPAAAVPMDVSGEDPVVFTFTGTGWGHNVGMSQYGSLAMAESGYTHEEILSFYYTGATLVQP